MKSKDILVLDFGLWLPHIQHIRRLYTVVKSLDPFNHHALAVGSQLMAPGYNPGASD